MAEDGDILLSVEGLKTYFPHRSGVVRAVEGVSFQVPAGRTVGLVGESGCGKTVTAKSLMQIVDKPGYIEAGRIMLRRPLPGGGETVVDVAKLNPRGSDLRQIRGGDIGLIFQEPMSSFSMVHTVGDQMAEALRMHGKWSKRAAREECVRLLSVVGISHPERRVDAYPFELSGGMRQRAMIALAISCRPRLLIADEPTTALDVTTQAQILRLLMELQKQSGMSIVMITHNLSVVATMCDEVVVMYLGQVVESGSVVEVFRNPKHPYTAMLLQSVPSIHSQPKSRLVSIKGSIPHPYSRPSGCTFHPRCPSFMKGLCDVREPDAYDPGGGHMVKCFPRCGKGSGR